MRATVPTPKRVSPPPTSIAALDQHHAEPAVAAQARLDQRAVAVLEDVQRQHARAGTARCRAGTSASAWPSAPPLAGPRRRVSSARARKRCRGRAAACSPPSPGRSSREHVELARGLRELPESTEQPGEVDPRWLSVMPGHAQPQPRRPTRPPSGRAAGSVCWRLASMRSTIARGPTGIEELRPERRAGVGLREQRRAPGEVERGRRRGTDRTTRPRRRPRGSGRHPDAVQLQPAAATDLDHHDAQGDRDAEVAVEHVVEERVARIAVVGRRCRGSPRRTNSSVASSPADEAGARAPRASSSCASRASTSRSGCACAAMSSAASSSAISASGPRQELGEALGDVQGSTVAPVR